MAIFRNEPEEFQRVDWMLLQDGAVTLYFRPQVLAEDVEWLKTHDYRVDDFDCSGWDDESEMHEALSSGLEFPDYYGRNLDALNDYIGDIEIPEESGRVLVFNNYDTFAGRRILMPPTVFWTSWKRMLASCCSLVTDLWSGAI